MTNDDREDTFSERFLKAIRQNYKPPTPELEMLVAQGLRNSKVEAEAIVKISSHSPDASPITHSPPPPSDKGSQILSQKATLPTPDISRPSAHLISTSGTATPMSPHDTARSVILGTTNDRQYLGIGDLERRNGLYILGKPRMGKSWLIVNMILQDIENGRGVFFIDPHGDAIDEILSRRAIILGRDNLLLEPDNPDCSCGINILACPDITDQRLRADTFARVKGFFDKIWKATFEDKPWLQLILQNTIYAFIENPAFTLAEFPMFFRDKEFRDFVAGNIKYNDLVRHYWLKTFASKTKRDQDAQMEAAQTRLEILLAHPTVRHIVGQQKSTIDFGDALKSNKSVLLKLSSAMSIEDKTLIGTLFVSELLSAIQKRTPDNRNLFCIYIDEFQNFASFEDFATLITQAPKFGITTTLAHHDRYGQLGDNNEIIGATAAIANKVLFQVTGKDAHEFAPEFAEEPPTELRREDQYAISQNPVSDLLHGHSDPGIRQFVNKYLRFLVDKRDDIKADMEGEKFARMVDLDTAAFYGAEAQEEGVLGGSHYLWQIEDINTRQTTILRARMHSIKLVELHKKSDLLRVTLRELNRFLTQVMEGEKRGGQESFSDFLISLASGYSALPEAFAETLGLYIKLSYGDRDTPRLIPFEVGGKIALFSGETARLTNEAARETADKRRAFEKQYKQEKWDYFYSTRQYGRTRRQRMKNIIVKNMAHALAHGQAGWNGSPARAAFLRVWPGEDGDRALAQAIADRAGYGWSIACIYFENYYLGNWYELDHFVPQMNYENSCAFDFGAERPGKEPLVVLQKSKNARSYMNSATEYNRKDVFERKKVFEKRWSYFSRERPAAARVWIALDEVIRWYLLMRSCDCVMYGKEFADRSFPEPSNSDYRWVVSSLVWLFEEHEGELVKKLEDAEEAEERKRIEKYCAESAAKIVVFPPAQLKARVLDDAQIRIVRNACIEEIKQGSQVVYEVAATIDEFARFCVVLAKPENHIKVRSGQYIEREMPSRTVADMTNEMEGTLTELPKYTAMAKILQGREMWKG